MLLEGNNPEDEILFVMRAQLRFDLNEVENMVVSCLEFYLRRSLIFKLLGCQFVVYCAATDILMRRFLIAGWQRVYNLR